MTSPQDVRFCKVRCQVTHGHGRLTGLFVVLGEMHFKRTCKDLSL